MPGNNPIANISPLTPPDRQKLELAAIHVMKFRHLRARDQDPALQARTKAFETAFGMQLEVPEVFDFRNESDTTLSSYGLQRGQTNGLGWQCLAARRLIEKGVRFVELIDAGSANN